VAVTIIGSIYKQGWDVCTIALVGYVLDSADDWGLIQENGALFALALTTPKIPITPEDIEARLDLLCSPGVQFGLRYETDAGRFLAIRRWDIQQRKYFSKSGPNCPIPPLEVFRKLSKKTRENFGECWEKLPAPIAVAVADAIAMAVDNSSPAGKKPRRSVRLTPEQAQFQKRLFELWTEFQRAYYRTPADKPVKYDRGVAAAHFAAWAREPRDLSLCEQSMGIYFKRRGDWRDREREKAKITGAIPPIVAVNVKDFIRQFEALYDEARRQNGDEQ